MSSVGRTMPDASDHLRAATDGLDDARTELRRAQEAADSEEATALAERIDETLAELDLTLQEMAATVDVVEEVQDDDA